MQSKWREALGSPQEMARKLSIMLLANVLTAIAINLFYVPNNFLSGGVGGIAILLYHVTGIPVGVYMFLINLPLAILGFRYLNKRFSIYAIISAFLLSFLVYVMRFLSKEPLFDDILMSALAGGAINGFGMGLLFRNEMCQGGIDFIAKILKERYNMNIGNALMAMNCVIVALGAYRFGVLRAMYTILAMRFSYLVLDRVQVGLDVRKQLIIVTEKPLELAGSIMEEVGRGVTVLHGMGAYTTQSREVLYCVVSNREIVKIKQIIDDVDPQSFVTIANTVEVEGRGFSHD